MINLHGCYKAFVGFSPYDSEINNILVDLTDLTKRHNKEILSLLASTTFTMTNFLVYNA